MKNRIIDFHTHIKNEIELIELLEINNTTDIEKTILCSGNMIPTGKIGNFLRGTVQLNSILPDNDLMIELKLKHPDKISAFFTIDPNYHFEDDIYNAIQKGFNGIKFNPIVHHVDFNSPNIFELLEPLRGENLPVYTHITLVKESSLESLILLAKEFTDINFVIGHMGFSSSDFDSIDACEINDNVYLETSIGSRLAFLEIKRRGLIEKLIFGSEYPLHDPRVELYKLKLVFDKNEMRKICYENSLKILKKVEERALVSSV